MKTVTFFSTLLVVLSVQAKVADFNSLISENLKAQSELHTNLQDNLELAKAAVKKQTQEKYIVDRTEEGINVRTNKGLLKFAKESTNYQPSEDVQKKRLAEELAQAE